MISHEPNPQGSGIEFASDRRLPQAVVPYLNEAQNKQSTDTGL